MLVSIRALIVVVAAILLCAIAAHLTQADDVPKDSSPQGAGPWTSPLIASKTVPIYQTTNNTTLVDNVLLGVIRYHYDETMSSCHNLLLLGVGTFMSVTDYDKISKKIASKSAIVVIVTDHNVNRIIKTSPQKYALLNNEVMHQLSQLLPSICGNVSSNDTNVRLLFGGHSASGQAAMQAWQQGLLNTGRRSVAFLGLDPYEISNATIDQRVGLVIPSLTWGFTKTTCLVNTEKAATAAFEMTKSSRVLYAIDNVDKLCATMTHCVFTNQGCGLFVCSTNAKFEWIHDAVAESIGIFLQGIRGAFPFDHSHFEPAKSLPCNVQVYVNKVNRAPNAMKHMGVTHQHKLTEK